MKYRIYSFKSRIEENVIGMVEKFCDEIELGRSICQKLISVHWAIDSGNNLYDEREFHCYVVLNITGDSEERIRKIYMDIVTK